MSIHTAFSRKRTRRPRLRVRLLLIAGFAVTIVSVATAQGREENAKDHSIQGISIGSSLAEARQKLDRLGKRDGRDTRDGGRKESWVMSETDFSHIAVRSNKDGAIVWVSGFLRLGRELEFGKVGEVGSASGVTENQSIWNFPRSSGGYRLVAKGRDKKASVIYMLSLYSPPIE